MGVPNEVQQIAKAIDAMTLDELMAEANGGEKPVAGGDYDTKQGWARRMACDRKSAKFVGAWMMLENAGLLKMCKGHVRRDDHLYTATLYHCPSLAKKIAERT